MASIVDVVESDDGAVVMLAKWVGFGNDECPWKPYWGLGCIVSVHKENVRFGHLMTGRSVPTCPSANERLSTTSAKQRDHYGETSP